MLELARFQLRSYTRSYKYFAPAAAVLIAMMLLYSYKPNPVTDSYAVTAVFLFIGMAWTGLSFLNHGHAQQEQLNIIHVGSMRKHAWGHILALAVITVFLTAFFIIYPLITGMFAEPVGLSRLAIAVGGHVVMGMLGASIPLFLQSSWIKSGSQATAIMLIVIIISLGIKSILAKLPDWFSWIRYVLPPSASMMDTLLNSEKLSAFDVWGTILFTLMYILLLWVIYIFFAGRKDARN